MEQYPLLTTIAAGFAAAWVLGLLTQRLGLSPIVGYLLGGILIGPFSPWFSADSHAAHELAEIGVILLMFGVGLHFRLKDLYAVKWIAVPGAVLQSLAAIVVTVVIFYLFGWSLRQGIVMGMAMAVASTVVLLRMLEDRDMLNTFQGHVAVGWLIVEDVLTVLALVFVPMLAGASATESSSETVASAAASVDASGLTEQLKTVAWAIAKLGALVVVVLVAGSRIVPWVLVQVARLRSRELFTLTVLVVSITVAVVSAQVFDASVALGAFLAGMVVGQSPVSHQAGAEALPMRDAFAVLFFVSVGMMFDPSFLVQSPMMVAAGLGIVMLAKPIAAMVIVAVLGYSTRTALTVAIGLAQVGEFSFILSQVGKTYGLMPDEGTNVLVATAIVSISLNPLWFKSLDWTEAWIRRHDSLWRLLNARADRRLGRVNAVAASAIHTTPKELAVIVGYGPVGRVVDALLRDSGMETAIIDFNMDTVQSLTNSQRLAVFGDATRREILEQAGVKHAANLIVTLPHSANRAPMVLLAREMNPRVHITVRARYLREREELEQAGAAAIVFEEGEAGIAMARSVMCQRGVERNTMDRMLLALRRLWKMEPEEKGPSGQSP